MLKRFTRHHCRRSSRVVATLLIAWLSLLPVTGLPQESAPAETSTDLTAADFDGSRSDDWTLTPGQARLLTALGVVGGMVALAALAAWCVTWLADRSPTGGPAPLLGDGDGDGRS
jgi:hypothetical protein